MTEEQDNYLCTAYPKIFADRHSSMQTTAMCWGFECNSGWFRIIDTLCRQIQHHLDWKNRNGEVVPQVVAEQVKEKFGTLRFYYRGGDDYIHGLAAMAEAMSGFTCEECGAPGEVRGGGWVRTLCETHEEARQADMKEKNAE